MSRTARGRVRLFNKRMMNKTYRELNLVVSYFMWLQIFILFFKYNFVVQLIRNRCHCRVRIDDFCL